MKVQVCACLCARVCVCQHYSEKEGRKTEGTDAPNEKVTRGHCDNSLGCRGVNGFPLLSGLARHGSDSICDALELAEGYTAWSGGLPPSPSPWRSLGVAVGVCRAGG